MLKWHEVAGESDLGAADPLSVKIGDTPVGLYLLDGTVYALEDVCPHAYALLSQGFVDGDEIECPLHGAVFHIPSGRCIRDPAERDLRSYPVKVEGGLVFVQL